MLVRHTVVAVIGQEQNPVLPLPGILVLHVGNYLVNHSVGIGNRLCRNTSDTQIDLITQMIASLAIIKIAHIILKDI